MNEFETNVLKKRPSETESVRFSRICAPVTDELELKLLGWMYYTNQIDTNELLKTFKIDRKKAYKLKQNILMVLNIVLKKVDYLNLLKKMRKLSMRWHEMLMKHRVL